MSTDRLRPLWVDSDVDATDRNLRAALATELAGDMLAWTKRGLELADRYPTASSWRGTLLTNLGDWHRERGEYERSLEAYEAALAACEKGTRNPAVMQEARDGAARAREALALGE